MTTPSERRSSPPRSSLAPVEEARPREYLAFGLAEETYALPLSSVREIMTQRPLTEVPRAPRIVLGIFSVRGGVTTLVDLRRCLRLPEAPTTSSSRVLLVEAGPELIGFLVDRVDQVYRLVPEEIELSTSIGGDLSAHVVGIGRPGTADSKPTEAGERSAYAPTHYAHDLLILLDPNSLMNS